MTNKKITDLAALASATSDDVLVIVDTATNTTKKITKGDFVSDVTSPPAGTDGQIQFNSSSAFGADSNLYWDNTNKRLGVGTSSPSASIHCTTFRSTSITDNGTVVSIIPSYNVFTTRNMAIGAGDLPARLGVKGSGSTSATTSLLVQNSSGAEAFRVYDDRTSLFSREVGINTAPISQNSLTIQAISTSRDVLRLNNTAGTLIAEYYVDSSNNGEMYVRNSAGTTKVLLSSSGNASYFSNALAVGASSVNASAILDATSTTKGFLPPRMTTTQKNAISSPAAGLMVYNTTTNTTDTYDGTTWQRFGQQTLIKGSGSTSATTSLLVQNSSGLDLFRINDNGAAFVGNYAQTRYALIVGSSQYPVPSAAMQVDSTTQGFLPPRMTTTQKNAISSPAAGLQVYDSTLNQMSYYNGSTWVNF